MIQDLYNELKNCDQQIKYISVSMVFVDYIRMNANHFGCIDFGRRRIFGILYIVCCDQKEHFKLIY